MPDLYPKCSGKCFSNVFFFSFIYQSCTKLRLLSITNYYLVSGLQSILNWIHSSGWTVPNAALYYSFDSLDGFVLMEGTQATLDFVPLVSGKVCNTSLPQENKQHEI